MHKNRGSSAVLLALCFALTAIFPGTAQQGKLLAALLQNGDFEGDFYPYGSGYVAEYWVPYDLNSDTSPPQYLRSTTHRHDGLASQQIWADAMPWYSGIMQTTLLTSQSGARIQDGKRYTVHVWVHSIYGGADGPIQHDRILKRVGLHPRGGIDPKASEIVWTPWHGQDKVWVQINAAVEAGGDRLTVFVEAEDEESGGQDQLYIDGVWLEEDGVPTPTRTTTQTPTATRTPEATETPTPTATPAITVLRTLPVGIRPQGVGCLPRANRFFVANHGNDTVSSLEGFFDWRHSTLPSEGHRPSGVAVDPERCRLYVTNAASDSVTVFNTCSNVRIDTIDLGEARAPGGIAVFAPANSVYVSNSAAGSLSVIDGDALTVGREIPVGSRPGQLAVNPVTGSVYVALRGNVPASIGAVAVIDAHTQSVRETIDLSATDPLAEPHGVAVNHITNLVYVALAGGQLVTIDGQTNRVVGALAPPHAAGLGAVAVNAATNHIFVSSTADNEVFVYDADIGVWLSTLPVGEGWPRGIGVNPLTLQVVVSNPYANTVTLIRDHGVYQPFKQFVPVVSGP